MQSLVGLGDTLVAAADYGEAVNVLTDALIAVQSQVNSDPAVRATVQHHLGVALIYDGRPAEALTALERSLAYRRDRGGGPLADTLLAVAWAHQRTANYEAAGLAIREALDIRESVPGHPGYTECLSLFGLQLWFEGKVTAARDASEKAVAAAEQTLRPEHPVLALALKRLAATMLDLGDVTEALQLKQRALRIAEQTFGPTHYDTWAYLNDLAEGNRRNGDYTAARALYLRALSIAEGRFGATHDSVATTVHNLALVDARLGDYIKARSEQARAIGIWERVLGPDHPFVAVALTELAAVYRAQGEAGNALPMLRRALRIRTRSLGPAHREVSKTFADVAAAYLDLDRLAEADAAIRRALEIWGATTGPETPDLAAMLDLMARIQAARGQLSDAQASYERALTIWNTSVGRLHPAYAEAQAGLAMALARAGRFDAAGAAAAEAEDAGRTHLRLMLRSLPERQALRYAITRPGGLGVLLSLASISPSAARRGYDRLVGSRALVLDEMTFRRATADLSPEARELYDRLTLRRRRLANLVVSGLATAAPRGFAPLLDGTRGEIEAIETELAHRSATFTTNTRRASIGLAEVRAALPAGTALVSFSRYERTVVTPAANATHPAPPRTVPSYIAFVLRAGGGEPVAVPLGSATAVDGAIEAWRDRAPCGVSRAPVDLKVAEQALRVPGAALRRRVWDPLATHLEGATRVFVVPDSALNLVPIAALPGCRRRLPARARPGDPLLVGRARPGRAGAFSGGRARHTARGGRAGLLHARGVCVGRAEGWPGDGPSS